MAQCTVVFTPFDKTVAVDAGTTLLEAALKADITIDSVCGGDGICGRCKMIVRRGRVGGIVTSHLTREEIRQGVVLACQTTVESDLLVEIHEETRAKGKITIDEDAQRFRAARPWVEERKFRKSPIVSKVLLKMAPPSLADNISDYQRLQALIQRQTGISSMQAGLKVIRRLSEMLRRNDFTVTAVVGWRRGVAEIMDIEGGDTSGRNFVAAIDVGTATIVAHLVDAVTTETIGTEACFNSQAPYGREVTARMIAAEKHGPDRLHGLLVEDINRLVAALAAVNNVSLKDITAVVCAGNTAMMHFLLGLPTGQIRRNPYVAVAVDPPPLRAAEVGIKINPRGLLMVVPGIGGWVGGDVAADILATGLHETKGVGMMIDVGTNGEIVVGNRDWLMACSAAAGPALEGAGTECGMMATRGAIEKVTLADGRIEYEVVGGGLPEGICGSGIIDLIAVMLQKKIIDRSGRLIEASDPAVRFEAGRRRFVLADEQQTRHGKEICMYQEDIDNVITAKAAIFAATKILLDRLDMGFADIDRLMIAGGFGSYINLQNAVAIGLIPDMPASRVAYVGNTSVYGAKLAALSDEAREILYDLVTRTTYYDLMGTDDYVDQFQQAMFLPHTNIELFPSAARPKAGSHGAS